MHAKSFVFSPMGVDAGETLNHIFIRKETERKTGGNWWWGLGSNIASELEREATSNGGTLPVLFTAVAGSQDLMSESQARRLVFGMDGRAVTGNAVGRFRTTLSLLAVTTRITFLRRRSAITL